MAGDGGRVGALAAALGADYELVEAGGDGVRG